MDDNAADARRAKKALRLHGSIARDLGVAAIRIERGDGMARISLRRPLELGPSRPARAKLAALILDRESNRPRLVTREVDVLADGKSVELEFDGEAFL